MNSKSKKIIINALVFILLVALTFYITFKNNDINNIIKIVRQVNLKYVIFAILCMVCFVCSEGINIARTLKALNCKISFLKGIKYALVGFFFSSVTPSSSGGDPMQLYYMKKDKLPIGKSALAILTEFSSFQFVTITISIISFIAYYGFIRQSMGNIQFLLIIGVLINLLILLAILLSIFSKRIIVKLLDFICFILNKFKYKKVNEFREKSFRQIDEYKEGAKLLKRNKILLAKIVTTTIVQVVLYHSIPYFIYLSFGLTGASYIKFVAIQSVLYISVSSFPMPGAVGLSEGGFMFIYNLMFPAELLSSAMLLSRGISFYLFVIISGIILLIIKILSMIYTKKSDQKLKQDVTDNICE